MLNYIDNFLNRITMYRLVLYYLCALIGVAAIISFLGVLPFNALDLLFSTAFIMAICWITNIVFSKAYEAPTNVESVYITSLILALIISPLTSFTDTHYFALAFWASVWSMASKYIFAINKKHLFNPAGIAVVITSLALGLYASWWVGTTWMLPFVLIGGLLITRKILRFDLVLSFLGVALVMIIISRFSTGENIAIIAEKALLHSPILFFAFVMLTEPLTTPPTSPLRKWYGAFTGLIFAPALHVGVINSTPELALSIGNIFSYLVGSKQKLMLTLKEKIKLSPDIYDFVFASDQKLKFQPGQYLEWTMAHSPSDSRGNRRYFTVASSPTEDTVRMGVRFYPEPSSFKKHLVDLKEGDKIVASQLAGDFILPKDAQKKLVFIAGGIGVTPYRSIIKYLTDTNNLRDITLLYAVKNYQDIVYKDIFARAQQQLGLRTHYVVAEQSTVPSDWKEKTGILTADMIKDYVPDYKQRIFYLSGPRAMVVAFDQSLQKIGVPKAQIKKDFFPGFA